MMFDKDLFLSLCESYGVEMSETATAPMIKDGENIHEITDEDVHSIFMPHRTYFDYSGSKINTKVEVFEFYLQEEYATAC